MEQQQAQFLAGICLADLSFLCRFQFPETASYFKKVLTDTPDTETGPFIQVEEEDLILWKKRKGRVDALAEFCLSCMPISDLLLEQQACIFHAAAVRRDGRAWLIAGGSGVGKTTHTKALLSLWSEEFSVITGDKPLLRSCDDGTILVCPSPWNGKEGMRGAEKAPLAGIFLLSRGEESRVSLPDQRLAAPRILTSVFQSGRSVKAIHLAASMAERILEACPVWHLVSRDVQDSARLLYDCIAGEDDSI